MQLQSTLPHGERPSPNQDPKCHHCFNPRSRTGSDFFQVLIRHFLSKLQSTLPHGERRRSGRPASSGPASIHAPARGATRGSVCRPARPCSFNPRSRTGSDAVTARFRAITSGFNPRSRTGSDAIMIPPQGKQLCFNPRSRTGSDTAFPVALPGCNWLQSTLPHGERHPRGCKCGLASRASIHAPARGATSGRAQTRPGMDGFNPRSRTGSDRPASKHTNHLEQLQSTLPHGERQS